MSDGYLTLARAGAYATGRDPDASSARWARRHLLGSVAHYQLPGSGIAFKAEDIDAYLTRFRREPVNLDRVVREVMRKPTARGKGGRFERKGATG